MQIITRKRIIGVLRMPVQTIDMIYEERHPLYEKNADIVVSTAGMTPEQGAALVHGNFSLNTLLS